MSILQAEASESRSPDLSAVCTSIAPWFEGNYYIMRKSRLLGGRFLLTISIGLLSRMKHLFHSGG